MISIVMGFLQSFTYAEIAGMFGNKSWRCFGLWRHGLVAILQFHRPSVGLVQLVRVVTLLSLGCVIAAGYILNALFPIPAGDSQMVLDYVAQNIASLKPETRGFIEWLAANAGKTPRKA